MINYFAYGSNMSLARINARVDSAIKLGNFILPHHELRFHKSGRDGSAKCDAFYTGEKHHRVAGVLFRISLHDKQVLDGYEGLGAGYEDKEVTVLSSLGEQHRAILYYATDIDPTLSPYDWYKEHVLTGAHDAGLPTEYIERIAGISALPDPDRLRAEKQRAIYF